MVSQQPNLIRPFVLNLEHRVFSPYINTKLLRLLQALEDEQSCSDYRVGEERQFIITLFQSTILPYTYYRIKRESEKHYKAFIRLEFFPGPSYLNGYPVRREEAHDYHIKQAMSCVSQANHKMRGPNGEILEIVIEDALQVDSCIPKHRIKLGPYYGHVKANHYRSSHIGCSLQTHEFTHLLGLADSYKYDFDGVHRHDCRVVQENSLLSDNLIRWTNVFQNGFDDSLLDPAHFQAILYGNCSLRNDVKLYRQCSHLAYQISDRKCLSRSKGLL